MGDNASSVRGRGGPAVANLVEERGVVAAEAATASNQAGEVPAQTAGILTNVSSIRPVEKSKKVK